MATLQDFRNERLRKLEELKRLGVNPYPAKANRTNKNSEVKEGFAELEGERATVVGRIKNIRKMGKIGFVVIKDESDSLQLFLAEQELGVPDYSNSEIGFGEVNLLDSGDFIEATGEVIKTKTGEISVRVNKLRILTKALRPMPLAHEEFSDVESRYRQRHIDFNVNEDVKEDILLRSRVTEIIRRFLIEKEFIEIETPVLQPIYGGASARPFVTYHHKLEADLFLRVSPELYLKRAIVGGFEKVFEFARNFRNEGIDRSHNPEFTMLEFYWSYADYNDLMDITTEMIHVVLKELFGKLSFEYQGHLLDFSNIKKYTFREIILEKTGLDIDKVTREELLGEIKDRKIEVDLKAPMKDLLDEFYKETCRKDIIQPIYLIDYPMEMIPLAKKKHSDPKYIESLQLVSCGFELLKAYSELNDPIDQLDRLTEDQKALDDGTSEEAMKVDIDFVSALEIGMPPTAGWGMGMDRFISFLANRPAIKDVIMFPTLKAEELDDATRKMYPDVNFGSKSKSKEEKRVQGAKKGDLPESADKHGTEKIYLNDWSMTSFEAKVVTVDRQNDQIQIVLDRTAFYPLGGGQACDTGEIEFDNGAKLTVVAVSKDKNGVITHQGELAGDLPGGGSQATGRIDVERRLLNSRLHCAGHFIDLAVRKLNKSWKPGKGAHYPDMSFVEYAVENSDGIEDKEVFAKSLEKELGKIISRGGEVSVEIIPSKEVVEKKISDYIPQVILDSYEKVHVVNYPDNFKICCGGTHVGDISEIGKINITKVKKKDGNIRVSYSLD